MHHLFSSFNLKIIEIILNKGRNQIIIVHTLRVLFVCYLLHFGVGARRRPTVKWINLKIIEIILTKGRNPLTSLRPWGAFVRPLQSGTKVPRTPLLSWIKKGLPYGFTMLNANLLFLFFYTLLYTTLHYSILFYAMLCYSINTCTICSTLEVARRPVKWN